MHLIDRTPGGFIFVANVMLYGTVLAETWMLTTGSMAAMGAVMVLIVVLAAFLCRFIMGLMGSEEYITGEETAVSPARPSTPARDRARDSAPARRRPATAHGAGPVRA